MRPAGESVVPAALAAATGMAACGAATVCAQTGFEDVAWVAGAVAATVLGALALVEEWR